MAKSDNEYRRRGNRSGMVLELEPRDKELLDKLVDKYQKLFAGKANKALVLRQLIRHAHSLKILPSLLE